MIPQPTARSMYYWILNTAKHSCHVEYFLQHLQVKSRDPQRPHDIVGNGNKFELGILERFALQYEPEGERRFNAQILEARGLHRQQHHHQMWNEFNPEAEEEDLIMGAVDAICSRLENRGYQSGATTYEEFRAIVHRNPKFRISWLHRTMGEMQRITQPRLGQITSLSDFPNIGISDTSYQLIRGRVEETAEALKETYGFDLRKMSLD